MAEPYQIYQTWRTVYEKRTITSDGAFAEDQIPDDYGGPELEVEIVQRIVLTDSAGHIIELRMDNMNGVQDDEEQEGVGATISLPEGEVNIPAAGPSSHVTTWYLRTNELLDTAAASKAQAMYEHMVAQEEGL